MIAGGSGAPSAAAKASPKAEETKLALKAGRSKEDGELTETVQEIVNGLVEQGKKNRNVLSYNDVMDALQQQELSVESMEDVFDPFTKKGIEITDDMGERSETDGGKTEEEIDLSIPEGISIDDPVRMYLKEIGRVSLLTRSGWPNCVITETTRREKRRPADWRKRICALWSVSRNAT